MLHIKTPIVESLALTKLLSDNGDGKGVQGVYLKLDFLQPSGSFKIRGVGLMCQKAVLERNCKYLVCASGGNAGKSVAYAGRKLNVPTTIVLPESAPPYVREKIQEEGASVIIHGRVFDEADKYARELAVRTPNAEYIPPFDHPDIWEGNATIIKEVYESVQNGEIPKPGVIVTVCGGGGLMCGIIQGLHEVGWDDLPIIVAETDGAHSLNHSIQQKCLSKLDSITSIAKTLGALQVCEQAYLWSNKHQVLPIIVSDAQAVDACVRFADDHRVLVEPACGTGLAVAYQKLDVLLKYKSQPILIIVCGGNIVSLEMLAQWKKSHPLPHLK